MARAGGRLELTDGGRLLLSCAEVTFPVSAEQEEALFNPARTAPCAPRSPVGWNGAICGRASSGNSDSALMKAFGKAAAGIFPEPAATSLATEGQFGVKKMGETRELRERFFAISVQRRLTHPAVLAVSEGARGGLFAAEAG